MTNEQLAVLLHSHIAFYIPKGWCGPIHEFTFAPHFLAEEAEKLKVAFLGKVFTTIEDGRLLEKLEHWFVKDAIKDFFDNKYAELEKQSAHWKTTREEIEQEEQEKEDYYETYKHDPQAEDLK